MDPKRPVLRWLFRQLIPTGTFFSEFFNIPPASERFTLEWVLMAWPITAGAARSLFVEVGDARGQSFTLVDMKNPSTRLGAKASLFTTPGTDPDPVLAGDQARYLGMMPIGIDFPGRGQFTVNIRNATAAPNPSFINLLVLGRQIRSID
jgi:hypothetical protein